MNLMANAMADTAAIKGKFLGCLASSGG